jgi:bifunctional N-acetylglucosamine-1-phosphate-uridyltransferase/glucosamine-1-phosphate-acetyltransferase GlmU-like protein
MMRVIVLAAGKGKRMGSVETPKVLRLLNGRPLLSYLLQSIESSGVEHRPVLVVGHLADKVKEVCGNACEYVLQKELRGTGDAVRATRELLESAADHVMVLLGDHPFVKPATIRRVVDTHLASRATLTMATVTVPDFDGWRKPFADFGRVTRDAAGNVSGIVEVKDATEAERGIKDVNPAFYCFKASWLWPSLEALTTDNVQGEYYLTALIAKAISEGEVFKEVPVPPVEAVGVNTPEQLALAEELLAKK